MTITHPLNLPDGTEMPNMTQNQISGPLLNNSIPARQFRNSNPFEANYSNDSESPRPRRSSSWDNTMSSRETAALEDVSDSEVFFGPVSDAERSLRKKRDLNRRRTMLSMQDKSRSPFSEGDNDSPRKRMNNMTSVDKSSTHNSESASQSQWCPDRNSTGPKKQSPGSKGGTIPDLPEVDPGIAERLQSWWLAKVEQVQVARYRRAVKHVDEWSDKKGPRPRSSHSNIPSSSSESDLSNIAKLTSKRNGTILSNNGRKTDSKHQSLDFKHGSNSEDISKLQNDIIRFSNSPPSLRKGSPKTFSVGAPVTPTFMSESTFGAIPISPKATASPNSTISQRGTPSRKAFETDQSKVHAKNFNAPLSPLLSGSSAHILGSDSEAKSRGAGASIPQKIQVPTTWSPPPSSIPKLPPKDNFDRQKPMAGILGNNISPIISPPSATNSSNFADEPTSASSPRPPLPPKDGRSIASIEKNTPSPPQNNVGLNITSEGARNNSSGSAEAPQASSRRYGRLYFKNKLNISSGPAPDQVPVAQLSSPMHAIIDHASSASLPNPRAGPLSETPHIPIQTRSKTTNKEKTMSDDVDASNKSSKGSSWMSKVASAFSTSKKLSRTNTNSRKMDSTEKSPQKMTSLPTLTAQPIKTPMVQNPNISDLAPQVKPEAVLSPAGEDSFMNSDVESSDDNVPIGHQLKALSPTPEAAEQPCHSPKAESASQFQKLTLDMPSIDTGLIGDKLIRSGNIGMNLAPSSDGSGDEIGVNLSQNERDPKPKADDAVDSAERPKAALLDHESISSISVGVEKGSAASSMDVDVDKQEPLGSNKEDTISKVEEAETARETADPQSLEQAEPASEIAQDLNRESGDKGPESESQAAQVETPEQQPAKQMQENEEVTEVPSNPADKETKVQASEDEPEEDSEQPIASRLRSLRSRRLGQQKPLPINIQPVSAGVTVGKRNYQSMKLARGSNKPLSQLGALQLDRLTKQNTQKNTGYQTCTVNVVQVELDVPRPASPTETLSARSQDGILEEKWKMFEEEVDINDLSSDENGAIDGKDSIRKHDSATALPIPPFEKEEKPPIPSNTKAEAKDSEGGEKDSDTTKEDRAVHWGTRSLFKSPVHPPEMDKNKNESGVANKTLKSILVKRAASPMVSDSFSSPGLYSGSNLSTSALSAMSTRTPTPTSGELGSGIQRPYNSFKARAKPRASLPVVVIKKYHYIDDDLYNEDEDDFDEDLSDLDLTDNSETDYSEESDSDQDSDFESD